MIFSIGLLLCKNVFIPTFISWRSINKACDLPIHTKKTVKLQNKKNEKKIIMGKYAK